jgi:ATP-dependent Lon protease
MNTIDQKANEVFPGKVVRKDLTSRIKGNASVPTYVLEYLLGQYCATNDEDTIEEGVETVRNIITKHFVHRDEANSIKSTIREKGSHRIIDKLSVRLNDRLDRYEANFANLGLNKVPISDNFIKQFPKLLSEGVWSIITIGYQASEEGNDLPWMVESIKPIQISGISIDEYKESRKKFRKEEWIDLLMQSIGLNPEEFSLRSKLIQLTRLVPFSENNYNLIELGPKGTGKSHIFSELSPHGILISGGEVSKAKLFVNNSNGEIGLVGYWDVVAYDEFAGKTKRADRGLVDIMKNYMANKSFSRGANIYQAEASMVFVGNTDHSVPHMLKHTDLFDALPKDYYDTAFLDRIHCYLPGWEVRKLRNEMFSSDYGFIVDYLAEVMKHMRKEDFSKSYQEYFELSNSITTRDKTAIEKTFSGLVKVIFPHGELTKDEAKILLDFAIESRKRVKDQLRKMDETFNDEVVHFSYTDKEGTETKIETLEILEYGDVKLGITVEDTQKVEAKKEVAKPKVKQLAGLHKSIRDNQSNVSYNKLFGDYLEGATEYTIRDPYIRLPYQMRNFMELCTLIANKKPIDVELKIHLVTNNNEDYIEGAKEAFKEIYESLIDLGIDFSYEFNEVQHDRSIEMNNGWKIILGRGLDIWQKTNGRFDIAEYYQEKRLCKEFEVTVLGR